MFRQIWRFFVFCFLMSVYITCTISKQIKPWGPYKILFREGAQCPDEGTKDFSWNETAFSWISRTDIRISARFNFKVPLDDSYTVNFNHESWGNGGWRSNFLVYDFPNACYALKSIYPPAFETIFSLMNVTDCPVPAGSEFGSFVFGPKSIQNFTLRAMPYNKYRVWLMIKKEGEIKGCIGAVADVVPLNSRAGRT